MYYAYYNTKFQVAELSIAMHLKTFLR